MLHSFLSELKIRNDQTEIIVHNLKMNDLPIHHGKLVLHFGDLLLPRALVSFELFDFVVQDIAELLELKLLLSEFINPFSLFFNGLLPLLNIHQTIHLVIIQHFESAGLRMDLGEDFLVLLIFLFSVLDLLTQDRHLGILGDYQILSFDDPK